MKRYQLWLLVCLTYIAMFGLGYLIGKYTNPDPIIQDPVFKVDSTSQIIDLSKNPVTVFSGPLYMRQVNVNVPICRGKVEISTDGVKWERLEVPCIK